MKVLKRVDEDLSSLSNKVTQWKVELVALEKKMLKLMEHINSALERIDDLEELAEKWDKRIWALEEEVEELKLKVCRCARVEDKIDVPEEAKRGHRMCLKHSDPFLYRRPLVWSTSHQVWILRTQPILLHQLLPSQ